MSGAAMHTATHAAPATRCIAYLTSQGEQREQKRAASRGRLPAYGKSLLQARLNGFVPERQWYGHALIVLDDWELGRAWPTRLVVGKDQDAGALDYTLLAGLDVVLIYNPLVTSKPERRDDLIRALVRVEVACLRVKWMGSEGEKDFWVVSREFGLERQEYAPC